MPDESAPPPVGSEPEPSKKKLRLKVSRVEEDRPRIRKRVVTTVPAAPVPEGAPTAPHSDRVSPLQILADLGRAGWASLRELDRKVWVWVGLIVALAVVYGAWTEWRKTVVRVRVELNDVRLGDKPEVLVLYDFTERLAGLKRDYGRRLAPIRPQIREMERTLVLAKADRAGTVEKTRMVEQVLNKETAQAKTVFEDYKTSVSKLWIEEAGLLDKEYDDTRKKFLEEVEVRAREVGLFYHPEEDADLQQPEIAANEYRLALYRAPPSIKMPDQFGWIDKKLSSWRAFEKDWNARYKGLGSRAKQLRSPANTSIDERKEKVGIQAKELEKFRADSLAIQKEIEDYEARLKELRAKEEQAKGPFEEDLALLPDSFLCVRVPLDADAAEIVVKDKVAAAAPGTLQIVVRGKKNGQAAWVIRPLEPVPHQRTEIQLKDADFQPVNDWLEE
ncbi:MAG: hypothetical protein EB090_03010 [Verrucomicrobia bacterium]|nr:hypothetical protein [Verrucomicrobiota bacterium]